MLPHASPHHRCSFAGKAALSATLESRGKTRALMGICARRSVQFFRCDSTCLGFVKESGAAARSPLRVCRSEDRRVGDATRPSAPAASPLGYRLLGCLWSQVSASLAKMVATRSTAAARSARRARRGAASARGRASSSPSRGTGKHGAAGPHQSALLTAFQRDTERTTGLGFKG